MVTLIGVILVVVGLSDFVAAAVIQRLQRRSDPSGLGQEQHTSVVHLLRMVGLATVVIGAVLVAIGLAS